MARQTPVSTVPPSVENVVVSVMIELQAALRQIVESLSPTVRRAVELQRTLKLDSKLAWQVFRIATADDPVTEAANVPAAASVRRFATAARRATLPESVVRRAEDAFDAYERCAAESGGDREGLISLVNGLDAASNDRFELKVRKSVFRGLAHVWGVKARMQLRTSICLPNPDRQSGKRLVVSGNLGLQRMRPGAPVTLSSWYRRSVPAGGMSAEIAAEEQRHHAFGFMPEFCSTPLPQMASRPSVGGTTEVEMQLPSAGLAGAADVYMLHEAALLPESLREPYALRMLMSVPTEEVCNDVLMPAGHINPATARAAVYGRRHHPEHVFDERPVDLLPQRESISYLGSLSEYPAVSGAPNHHRAVAHVLRTFGAEGMRFDVFRCRVKYPALHTLLVMHMEPDEQVDPDRPQHH